MCTLQLHLLTVVVLMLPDAAQPQPSSPARALPTYSVLGPVTPEVATAAPPDSSEGPTPWTSVPEMPENATTDPFPGDAARYGIEILTSQIKNSVDKIDLPRSRVVGLFTRENFRELHLGSCTYSLADLCL